MGAFRRVCAVGSVLLSACGVSELSEVRGAERSPFISVSRGELTADPGLSGASDREHFYVAIAKADLGKRWFMSGYLTQWHPAQNLPVRSLGTRVVSFAVQNGKLFVFDLTAGKAWSDALDPTVVVEAYPLVTDFAPFNGSPLASAYVLFDPAAGQNRFDVVSDDFAATYQARFEIDVMFLQRFRALADGAAWEQVFTGHTEVPGPGVLAYEQPFRGSGTVTVTLRRYAESTGFVPTEFTDQQRFYFPSQNWQLVKNEPRYRATTAKWNVAQGMRPIQWRISTEIDQLQADPKYQGIDVAGAITRGVESWNAAFGFPVFEVVRATAGENAGDDEKNFVVVDRNPGAGYAFANWRENPNTGEIRGASVYLSAAFIDQALNSSADAGVLPALPPPPPPAATCAPAVVVSQVYGGGSSSAAFNQDFVELHNRSPDPVSLLGWSIQYASAAGSTWQVVPLSGTVAPGGFLLVGLASAVGGTPLPAAEVSSTVNLSASAGKVALVSSTTPLIGACPATGATVDLLGYGSSNCAETMPSASPNGLAVIRGDVCADTDSNALNFVVAAPAPRNSGTPVTTCSCAPPAPMGAAPSAPTIAPQAKPSAPALSWQALPAQEVCKLGQMPQDRALPAGMTRRDFVERTLQHTVAHEIGHVLGLRHNFMGSLTASSVMDYVALDDSAASPSPLPYDVAAVRYLYGLDPSPPTQPFCTDDERRTVAQCDAFDSSATPLQSSIAPRYQARVRGLMAGTGGFEYADYHRVTRYVRGASNEAERLEAFNILMADLAPPLRPEVVALSANAAAYADLLAELALANLFLDPPSTRDEIGVNPPLNDDAFRGRVIAVATGILTNSDQQRSFPSRRSAIDVLKALQTSDGLQALLSARATLLTERARHAATGQALIDDLVRRIDLQCSPYFNR